MYTHLLSDENVESKFVKEVFKLISSPRSSRTLPVPWIFLFSHKCLFLGTEGEYVRSCLAGLLMVRIDQLMCVCLVLWFLLWNLCQANLSCHGLQHLRKVPPLFLMSFHWKLLPHSSLCVPSQPRTHPMAASPAASSPTLRGLGQVPSGFVYNKPVKISISFSATGEESEDEKVKYLVSGRALTRIEVASFSISSSRAHWTD